MLERLSAANEVVWANPYGTVGGALLPRITTLKEGLTIYNPGINLLPLQSLRGLNERRRLLQVKLYLLGRDFEPDLIWFDDPPVVPFAAHYRKQGAAALYYAAEDSDPTSSRTERKKLVEELDLVVTPSPALYKKYGEHTPNAHLLSGGDLMPPPEAGEDELPDELLEKAFMEALEKRTEEISRAAEKALARVRI